MSGRITFVPFQFASWDVNDRADIDVRSHKRIVRSIVGDGASRMLNAVTFGDDMNAIAPVTVGLAAT